MPSPAFTKAQLLDIVPTTNAGATNETRIPAASGTSTAGTETGAPPSGARMINSVGTIFSNLPSGGNVFQPAALGVNRWGHHEPFLQRPALKAVLDTFTSSVAAAEMVAAMIANRNFSVIGTNMTTALCTFLDGGGILLTTAGASNDQGILLPQLSTNQSAFSAAKWNTLDSVVYRATVRTGAAVTSQKLFMGLKLTNTPLTATDDNQAYFLYDTGNTNSVTATNWQICTSRAGVDVIIDSGIALVALTSYELVVSIDVNRVPYFYINGVLVGVGNGTRTTGVTTSTGALTTDIDLIPYVGVQSLTSAAKTIGVRWLEITKYLND